MIIWKLWCLWYDVFLLYEVCYVNEHVIGVYFFMRWWLLMLQLYEAEVYIWSPILSTWLCRAVGLHIIIALVGLGWDNLLIVLYVMCIWYFEYESLSCLYDNMSLIIIMLYVDGILSLYMFNGMCAEDIIWLIILSKEMIYDPLQEYP